MQFLVIKEKKIHGLPQMNDNIPFDFLDFRHPDVMIFESHNGQIIYHKAEENGSISVYDK